MNVRLLAPGAPGFGAELPYNEKADLPEPRRPRDSDSLRMLRRTTIRGTPRFLGLECSLLTRTSEVEKRLWG
jgi:hypothetical protein